MTKIHKSIFNVNGCTVVKHEQSETSITITVKLSKGNACRCSCCGRRGKLYDNGRRHRVWRTLDLGTKMGFIKMNTYRVKCKEVLQFFMNELSEEQRAGVEENLPNAERCVDGFHVVQWVTDALGKAPENLTESQQKKLELIANQYPKLYRAYQLKEELRIILKMPYPDAIVNLDRWLWRASHSRIDAMKKLYEKVKRSKAGILNTIRLGMSNARIEATNNKIKLLIRTAYGFRNMENMLSLIMLSCSYVEVKIAYKWEAECQKSSNKAA